MSAVTRIRPIADRRDRYIVELTWAQVEALRASARNSLYGTGGRPNANALRHAIAKLALLRYRPTRGQREAAIR